MRIAKLFRSEPIRFPGFLACLMLCNACSTITTGSSQNITVTTNPAGAVCTLDRGGQRVGAIPVTPATLVVSKSSSPLEVECNKQGYMPAHVSHKSDFAAATAGNLLLGGVVGIAIDAASGAANVYPPEVRLALKAEINPAGVNQTSGITSQVESESSKQAAESRNVLHRTTPEAATPQPNSLGLKCPSAGTRVVRSDGTRLRYEGADEGSPDICVVSINGKLTRSYFGIWPADGPPNYDAYSSLLKLEQMQSNEVSFTTPGVSMYRETWSVGKTTVLQTESGALNALELVHEHEGMFGNGYFSKDTYFIDRATGVVVGYRPQHVRGLNSYLKPWTIVELRLAGG